MKKIPFSEVPFYVTELISGCSLELPIWYLFLTQHKGLPSAEAISCFSFCFLALALSDLPLGMFADRRGRVLSMTIAYLLRLFGVAFYILGTEPISFSIAAALTGIGWAFASGSPEALVIDTLTARENVDERYTRKVISSGAAALYAGRTISFVIAGFLYLVSPTLPFFANAAVLTLAGFATLFFQEEGGVRRGSALGSAGKSEARSVLSASIQALLGHRLILRILLFVTATQLVAEQLWVRYQALGEAHAFSALHTGLLYSFGSLVSFGSAWSIGRIESSNSERYLLMGMPLGYLCGAVAPLLIPSSLGVVLCVAFLSVSFGMVMPLKNSAVHHVAESEYRATALSVVSSFTYIMFFLLCLLSNLIEANFGLNGVFSAAVILIILLGLLGLFFRKMGRMEEVR